MACSKATRDLSGKMLVFPQESATAHVRLTPHQEKFTAVTVCQRIFTDLTRLHAVFSLATPCDSNAFVLFMLDREFTFVPHVNNVLVYYGEIDFPPNKWHSVCTTWDSCTGLVQVWLNGQPLPLKYASEKPITGKPIVVLGQEQDTYGGGFKTNNSFVGMMSDVHMWDYVLSPCEIQKYMKDQNFTPGNVLNWAALDCEIKGRVVIENKQTGCIC